MVALVVGFGEVDRFQLPLVGGKGANLGDLSSIARVNVPEGFCVTTEAYRCVVESSRAINSLIDTLSSLALSDNTQIASVGRLLRATIEALPIPVELEDTITRNVVQLGKDYAYAVRSSATAEDLPGSSFAGQQDTYLNVHGATSVVEHVKRCWASLFTDRAIVYRIQNQFDHRSVQLSVVVQRMIFPEAAGIMFTADPVTSNRRILSIDASFGLGEAMVSGLVNADTYRVCDKVIIDKKISSKAIEIVAKPGGGTIKKPIEPARQDRQTLSDDQILRLAALGRQIENHFGSPQDIEWGLAEGDLYILQSRPITTLYPVPPAKDAKNHVYISYGHRQIMTDAFRPLGLSLFARLDEALGRPPMEVAGGRFYKDMSHELANPLTRSITIKSMSMVDKLMADALLLVTKRKQFMRLLARGRTSIMSFGKGGIIPLGLAFLRLYWRNDPSVVPALIEQNERSVAALDRSLCDLSGDDVFARILDDHQELAEIMFEPRSVAAAFVGIHAANWLNRRMKAWLGEENAADVLAQSAPYNVVAAMGLDLLDVADLARPHLKIVEYLATASRENFFTDLEALTEGDQISDAIKSYLRKYGMHCSGDIDITRTRWSEDPTLLMPLLLANIRNFPTGRRKDREEKGRMMAESKRSELLGRLRQRPCSAWKVRRTKKYIKLLRHFIGYREYSKHALLQRWWLYKRALLKEAARLAAKGVIKSPEDVYFLSLDEFRQVANCVPLDYGIISNRQRAFEEFQQLKPPRVLTSEGEVIQADHKQGEVPVGALPGTAVSAGIVEGRARIVMRIEDANVEEGDILVTVFTDPSWSPLFVAVKGVVMEIGGVMTHGAVIAREYGLPAVVGVENVTKRIKDGQRIRVNGHDGYIEILEPVSDLSEEKT